MKEDKHYFGEWVEILDESELEEATEYLGLWAKYFQRKVPELKLTDSQIIYRPKGIYHNKDLSTIGVKIEMEGQKPKNVFSLNDLPIDHIIF